MTPEQAAHETRDAISRLGGAFMSDERTYAFGKELGFDGFDFYVAGRGGVLGDVVADVVAAAMVFIAPGVIHDAWRRTANVLPRREAGQQWAIAAHEWARVKLTADVDWTRVAELAGRIVAAAPVGGAPIFAAWRTLPEPDESLPRAAHHLNALRELRGAMHAAAVLTVGLTPVQAIAVRAPNRLGVAGWPEPSPDAAPLRDRWQLAEARTDRMFGRHLAVLDDAERQELVETLTEVAP